MTHQYSNKIQRLLTLLLAVLVGTTLMTASFATQALAQDDEEEEEFLLEDLVITGSRIMRNNMESTSPIVTVDEKLFDQSATLAIETQLNKLPQFTPTMDLPTFGGDIQPTARNTPGEATVALRGLGANRNLVLINGRRGTPSGGGMYVDINTIPLAAIEYVEVISGGASAVYGADAMSGVVNFIMKDDFEGLEIDYQMGIDEADWDGFEHQISALIGSNIADDRGNVSVAFSYNRRENSQRIDRDWYRDMYMNPDVGSFPTRQFFPPFTGFVMGGNPDEKVDQPWAPPGFCAMIGGFWCMDAPNYPNIDVMNAVIDGANFTEPDYHDRGNGVWVFNDPNGNQAFTGFAFGTNPVSIAGSHGVTFLDGIEYMRTNDDMLRYTNVSNYLILPMERFNLFTQGDFEINDWIGVFMQGYFSKVKTDTIQEPSPITTGWAMMIDPTTHRDMIPEEIMTLLDSREYPDLEFQLQSMFPFNRTARTEVYTYNLTAGLEGTLPVTDWTWEFFVNHGEAETSVFSGGNASLQRLIAIMQMPNFGQGAEIKGNQGPPNNGFGASTATCTSGLNPFDWASTTPDCWNAVLTDIKDRGVMEQTIWEANAQGAIIDLPAGEMRGALGLSYRRNNYYFNKDTITTEGRSFMEQAMGLYPADNTYGIMRVEDIYGELLIPVVSDLPFMKQLNLELGGRRSDYDTTGSSYTYKILADWRANDWLRFRGGYNRAERAPNMAELFLAPEQIFSFGVMRGDPCALGNLNPYGSNDEVNTENWANAVSLCGQLMEASGNQGADQQFYGADYRVIMAQGKDAATNPGALGAGGGGAFPHTVGNPDLTAETADTWTVGVVFDSNYDNPWLSDLRISLDWYSIDVSDAIGEQSSDMALQQCFDPAFNPTYDPNSLYCQGTPRTQTGAMGEILTTFWNNGAFDTSGLDLQLNWAKDMGPGRVGFITTVNYLIDKNSTELLGVNPMVDYVGTTGPYQNGLNGASYEWRMNSNLSYTWEDLRVGLVWRYVDGISSSAYVTVGDTRTQRNPYSLFDLQSSYNLTDNLWLRFGIENLFNEAPPFYNVETEPAEGALTGGSLAGGGIYDTRGRRFYLGASVNFD